MEIEWAESATKDLDKLDTPIARRISKRITWLSNSFQSVVPERLAGGLTGPFKLRVGDWRVVYTVEGNTIVIQFIGHRREIYRAGS
jgi:mRNA interferase RelE/StbE